MILSLVKQRGAIGNWNAGIITESKIFIKTYWLLMALYSTK